MCVADIEAKVIMCRLVCNFNDNEIRKAKAELNIGIARASSYAFAD